MIDPFRGTLLVLPLVVAGFWWLGNWVRRQGGEVLSARAGGLQAGALVLLVLSVLGREHLGLSVVDQAGDRLLAGGLALVLFHHAFAVARGVSRARQSDPDAKAIWPFFVLPLVVYLAVLPWAVSQREPDGDEPYYLLIAHSLAYDFDTDLTNNYGGGHASAFLSRRLEPEWADPVRTDGRLYSRHSFILPLVLAPAYRLAGKWGAFITMAVLTALVACLSLRLGRSLWPQRPLEVCYAWALIVLTPPLLLFSHQIWVEVPAALLLLVALLRIDSLRATPSNGLRDWVALSITVALLPLLKLRFIVLSMSLLVLAWWRAGRSRRGVVLLAVVLVTVTAGILLYNQLFFGAALKDHAIGLLFQIQARSPARYLQGAVGLFWDCAFGLFASNPLWLLLVPGLAVVGWRRLPVLTDLMLCALPYLAVIAPRLEWYGAWAPPFRFGLVLLPILGLALVPMLEYRRRAGARAVVTALAAVTLPLALLWVVIPGWTYNLALGTNHLLDHLALNLAADSGRFFPSFVRLRSASWIVPLSVGAGVLLLWWHPRSRSAAATRWGVATVLLALAALPVAATRLPTRCIEFEDRQVEKTGGSLYPEAWVPYRPRFRSGWMLAPGNRLRAPVVPAGERVTIRLDLRLFRSGGEDPELELSAGEIPLGRRSPQPTQSWQTLTFEEVQWPGAESLTLGLHAEGAEGESRLVVDRAELVWD